MIPPSRSKPSRWTALSERSPEWFVRSGMILGGAGIISLVGYELYRFPVIRTWSSDGLLAALVMFFIAMGYGLIGWLGTRSIERRRSRLIRLALPWGLAAGSMFGFSMLGEYVIPHDNRQGAWIALAVFGTFFAILFAAGFSGTRATGRLTTGALTGLWSALIASQLWVLFLVLIYACFLGTLQEARFLEVDQVIADFERSGQKDLRAFIFGDYTGAAFFHSVLGAMSGLLWGQLGGLAALPFATGRLAAGDEVK